MERRLAAILAADIVGYSRLMGEDSIGTLDALREFRSGLLEPVVSENQGIIAKSMGDGWLMEFASAADAVSSAVQIQKGVADNPLFKLRMGVHIGDVTHDDEEIYGDGINIAARLQTAAEPGGIVISEFTRQSIDDKLAADFVGLGAKTLKNIAEPIMTYGWGMKPTGKGALPLPAKPSIAVLPFVNMSGDREKEYLADGISEDVITGLSQVRWLFVIARNSSLSYKGTSPDVRQVGRELGVRYVIEGSVRTGGNRIRVSAQLVDAVHGKQLWAERYDRELADIFLLQDEITERIVAAIQPELNIAEQERARRKPPENLDAWEAYQRGLWHLYHFTNEHFDEALKLFSRAIDLDPNFAPSLAGKAYVHIQRSFYSDSSNRRQTLSKGIEAARAAVNQDDKDATAHFSLGRALCLSCEFDPGIDELETALSLNPSFAQAHFGLGHVLAHTGRMETAINSLDRAIRLSPHDPHLFAFYAVRALAHFYLGRYEEAVAWASKSVRAPHATFWPHLTYTATLAGFGRLDDAKAAYVELARLRPGYTAATVREDFFFTHDQSIVNMTINALRAAGLPD